MSPRPPHHRQHRAIRVPRHVHPRHTHHLPRLQVELLHRQPLTRTLDLNVLRHAPHVAPADLSQTGLQAGSIKLAIAQEAHCGGGWHAGLDLLNQAKMRILGTMALPSGDDHPRDRQRASLVDQANHQGDNLGQP